ncbi:MAG: hypothetical protein AAF721_37615 [Myxococcota bacterium]
MYVVAIVAPEGAADPLGDALATITGRARYEMRTRLRVLGRWPGVLDTYAEEGRAEAVRAAAVDLGCTAWVLPGELVSHRVQARRFSLQGAVLQVVVDAEQVLDIDVASVQMLLAGNRYGVKTDHNVERPARPASFLSATMAIPTASNASAVIRRSETREGFVHLYAAGHPTVVFGEATLQYAALALGRLEPTRRANFDRVSQGLRRLCARATWDDRLLQRLVQARLLGPTLRPERYLDHAIALLTRRLGAGTTPYR